MTPNDPPAKREVEQVDTLTLDWQGYALTLPATTDDWPLDTIEAMEAGQAVTAIRALIGDKEWAALKAHLEAQNGRRPSARDFAALLDAIASEYGFTGAGE